MPRQARLDIRDAFHYVHLRGRSGAAIFFDPRILRPLTEHPRHQVENLRRFEQLIVATLEECATVLHAYSIEPNAATLVLQTRGALLNTFMGRLCGQYSRHVHAQGRMAKGGGVFAGRYGTRMIAPEYLPHAARRAHRAPIVSGLCNRRMDYPFSSERAYVGERSKGSVLRPELGAVRGALALRGHAGLRGYREFMDRPESPYVAQLFTRGSPDDGRIIGGKLFVRQVRQLLAHPPPAPARERLITGVAQLMNKPSAVMFSHTREGVLGRALVAWHAVREGSATLSTVGRWFSVTGATLGQAIQHHRRLSADLFRLPLPIRVGSPAARSGADGDADDED